MNPVFPIDKLPYVRELWLRGLMPSSIAQLVGSNRATVAEIIRYNTVGKRWPQRNMELPAWIDAT